MNWLDYIIELVKGMFGKSLSNMPTHDEDYLHSRVAAAKHEVSEKKEEAKNVIESYIANKAAISLFLIDNGFVPTFKPILDLLESFIDDVVFSKPKPKIWVDSDNNTFDFAKKKYKLVGNDIKLTYIIYSDENKPNSFILTTTSGKIELSYINAVKNYEKGNLSESDRFSVYMNMSHNFNNKNKASAFLEEAPAYVVLAKGLIKKYAYKKVTEYYKKNNLTYLTAHESS